MSVIGDDTKDPYVISKHGFNNSVVLPVECLILAKGLSSEKKHNMFGSRGCLIFNKRLLVFRRRLNPPPEFSELSLTCLRCPSLLLRSLRIN